MQSVMKPVVFRAFFVRVLQLFYLHSLQDNL